MLGETGGILPGPGSWTSQAEDRISFGQSVSVNAVQMAAAVNTIANGGVRVDPEMVRGSATMADGTVVGTDTTTKERVISERAADQMARMMERVIDPDAGRRPRGGRARLPRRGQDRHRAARRRRVRLLRRLHRPSPSPGSPRPTTRSSRSTSWSSSPARAVAAARSPGPAFAKIMGYALRQYGVAPTGAAPSTLPVEW